MYAYSYSDLKLDLQYGQQDIVDKWKSGEITKDNAVKEIKDLRENLAEKYCEINDCKIVRNKYGS